MEAHIASQHARSEDSTLKESPSQEVVDIASHHEQSEVSAQVAHLERVKESLKEDTTLDEYILESWRQEDSQFVPTTASQFVEDKIKSQNLVTVVGNSGCGKTAVIQHIALKLKEEGWVIKPVDEVREIKDLFSTASLPHNETLFVLNDPIGKETLDEISYNSWKTYEKTIVTRLEKVKLLVSCRKSVISDKRLEGILKKDSNIVEIDNDKLKLSAKEKEEILEKYCHHMHLSKETIKDIVKTEAYFPLLCNFFSNKQNCNKEGVSLFKHPFNIIKKDIERLKELDKRKYCGLILIAVVNNNLNVETIRRNENSLEKYRIILGICELPENTNISVIRNALQQLKGSYVKRVGHTFQFLHDFIMEITTLVCGVDCPQETIQYAHSGFLRRRVKIEDDTEKEDRDPFTVYLPEEYIGDLVDRFIIDMQTEHIVDVLLNPCLRKENVIKCFKEKVDSLRKILVRIKCEIDRSEFESSFKRFGLSRLGFLIDLKEEICPLIGFIIFCHDDISSFFLNKLNQTMLKDYHIVSALCANGKTSLLNSLSEEYKKNSNDGELVRLGADVNEFTTNDKWTPLSLAAANDEDHLKEAGIDTKTGERPCQNGHENTVQLLLTNGSDINLCENNRATPLHIVCYKGHDSMVQLLLNNGADINRCYNDVASALHIACENGHHSTVRLLLKNGANINICDNNGVSPLFVSCQKGHYSTVQLLLNNGADINLCENDGYSPLCVACFNGHDSTVKVLLKSGADINLCNKNGFSPLCVSCYNGHDFTVQLLLKNCADINFCDNEGNSPLFLACYKGHDCTVKVLLDNGADVNIRNKNGECPLSIAKRNGHDKTVQLLIDNGAS
ncbi:uncharacterized protein LOC134249032 [Saccostrea cucullata]|uniref:uncharacterized protein LOC134249032 n=1 Tax=Saccostrea cuccullata TaxID=36930 RepID=UPI002ED637AE